MNWSNVKLIFVREMRDQLRDRRTLFLIAVLPLLLYPLLGMSFFQLSQFLQHHAAKVAVLGAEELENHPWLPRLFDKNDEKQFQALWFSNPNELDSLQLLSQNDLHEKQPPADPEETADKTSGEIDPLKLARSSLDQGEVQVVLYFPPGFGERLETARHALIERTPNTSSDVSTTLPEPHILYNSANEKSRVALLRVERVLRNWRTGVMQTNLRDSNVPLDAARPFQLQPQDVAQEQQRSAAVWSKILPFVLFIWALTGAFYPAIDLCAGEKERGTLETLLASPALRREIVWGKLLTVMTFSVVTALLNLGSLGLTGKFVLAQLQETIALSGHTSLSLPPLVSILWLVLALIPIAALFSALCLACAAFARSTKEGQYYLMPLLLIVMPLMMLPLSPGVELTLGNSLIPITGVVLLLRSVIEGQSWQALPYVVPVVGITLLCCSLAIRWAEEQFNRESVLFREGERLDLGRWLVHLVRDRTDTPTLPQSLLCVALIMMVQFFVSLAMSARSGVEFDFPMLVQTVFISVVVCIALPAAMMTLLFTRRPWRTLLLDRLPKWSHVFAAVALAFLIHPLGVQFVHQVSQLYPGSPEVAAKAGAIAQAIQDAPYWWMPILLLAVLPALCEEIAFRGFVLSGLRHLGHKWWAIGLSSLAFGMAHFFLQQKISAAAVGLVLGFLAVQTASLVPSMVFHAIYNTLSLSVGRLAESAQDAATNAPIRWFLRGDDSAVFQPWVLAASAVGAAAILWWLHRLPHERTDEEQLQETRQQQLQGDGKIVRSGSLSP